MLENMLDYFRFTLYALLIGLGFLLFQAWDKDHPRDEQPAAQTVTIPTSNANNASNAPSLPEAITTANSQTLPQSNTLTQTVVPKGKLIKVTTDVLNVTIDTQGGDVVEAKLLKYPESLGSKVPFELLNDNAKTRYIAESGLLSQLGPDTMQEQGLYTTSQDSYALAQGANDLVVNLIWQKDGLVVKKTFTFARNSYEIKVQYEIDNASRQAYQANWYAQLLRTNTPPTNNSGFVNLATFFGAAISSPQKSFEKLSFKDLQEKNLNNTIQGGWAAMIQHYFISSWVPPKEMVSNYYSHVTNGLYTIGMMSQQPIVVEPNAKQSIHSKLYVGPVIADQLEKTAPGLKMTIDYGWFWFISIIIFWMMDKIYDVVGNWGWSIVLVTIIIKLIFYHLSAKSYRSMSALKRLQPRIEILKERFGDDKQKLTQATLELYREEKVNPMSGCLPVLIQIPVFIALYWVLVESVQLRQAPFILWIHDLSQPDPYYVLPILMGISMFLQQRLNPPPPDPLQAKLMMLMPVVFTVMFANFPSGLMLYWFVNITLSCLQQWYIMRSINR